MQTLMMVLRGALGLLPILGGTAVVLIAIQAYKVKKLGKQFADCVVRRGIVHKMEIREATQVRPYRHCVVVCSFSGGNDLVEILYDGGELDHIQLGDEIPLYFYPNGAATVVAYDADTVKKKLRKQAITIVVLCAALSFVIPTVGLMVMNLTR